MSAYIGQGIAEGARYLQKYEQGRVTREANQADALARRKKSELQLKDYENQQPLRDQEHSRMMAESKLETRKANQQLLKSVTFDAFDKYEVDGDTRHLNNMLSAVKKNPIGAKANSPIVRYDSLSDTPEIRQKMKSAGYEDFDGILADKELNKSFVVTTDVEGKKSVWDVDKVYAMSGYGKHMSNQKLDENKKRAEISELVRKGMSVSEVQMTNKAVESMIKANPGMPYYKAFKAVTEIKQGGSKGQDLEAIKIIAEDAGIPILEATEKYYAQKNSGQSMTDQERYVQAYMSDNEGSTREEAVGKYKNENRSSKSKDIEEANLAKDSLDEIDFLDMDMSSLSSKERAGVQRKVASIQRLLGVEVSTEDKRVLRDLNNLTMLGGVAGEELTPNETGLMDSMLSNVKKYMFDEVGGAKGTSSYETFRNIFRNSLYGATLTPAEIKAFNKAAGTLGQKFQPVMQRLNTQMTTIKSQLESIRDTNDPYVAKYYLGNSVDNIDEAIRQIDSRIDMVSSARPAKVTTKQVMDNSWQDAFEDL
tara:strand:+ start:565 stop:2172 length:1608 start_codon:yes stop_codon:yes gene_type:complete